jgi:high-affinity iron transporter
VKQVAPLLAALLLLGPASAVAANSARGDDAHRDAALAVLKLIPDQFTAADPTHDVATAARTRALASIVRGGAASDPALGSALEPAARLRRTLAATRVRLQPWPLPQTVREQSAATAQAVNGARAAGPPDDKAYDRIDGLLSAAASDAAAGAASRARLDAAGAYALFMLGPGRRLGTANSTLAAQTEDALWNVVGAADRPSALAGAGRQAQADVQIAATVLGDATISRATVIADAGVIVFREGLEAVLILAAITASFTGARRRLRRPVLIGGLVGLLATVITYLLAETIVAAVGDGGLRLQAITGLLAIAVLLLVTNWFFHRVYWSQWIGRFNRRRKMLERVDRLGFVSGQALGFVLLGLTSVYREGFETVLFLQNLEASAGTGAVVLGVGAGLAATAVVGLTTFALERKLPYRKMLIATGVLIGFVLAIMVGTTVHSLQGLDWISTTPTPFELSLGWGRWLGLYPNWEGISAQFAALLVVYGSYAVARARQKHRSRRAISRSTRAGSDVRAIVSYPCRGRNGTRGV